MKKFKYKGREVLLKDLYALTDMNKNRVNRLLDHHEIRIGDDVTDVMCISAWHAISTRKTGSRYLFRGEKLTYTEISSRIPLGVRAVSVRIKNAGLQIGEDASHLFNEFSDNAATECATQVEQVAELIRTKVMHPYEAWTEVKGRSLGFLANALGIPRKHLYHLFITCNSRTKTLSKVSVALEVQQEALRDSFEIYKEQLKKLNERYCEAITNRLSADSALLKELPNQISRKLCEGKLPVSIIKEYLGLSNESIASKMGLSTQAFVRLKKTIRPQNKTIVSLSEISGIGTEVLFSIFAICRQAKKDALGSARQ